MRQRGFLGRFLYALPKSRMGQRKARPAPVPKEVADAYAAKMSLVWELDAMKDEDGNTVPTVLRFSAEADRLMEEFQTWLEPQLAEGKPLSHLGGWANKLAGAVARVAGILHMAAGAGGDCGKVIDVSTARAAVRIGKEYLLPHAQAAFRLMGADPRVEDARRIVRWLEQRAEGHFVKSLNSLKGGGLFTVSQSEVHAEVFGGSRLVEDVDPVLGLLVEYGYLRPTQEDQRTGPGRKASQRFVVNPHVRKPQ
jgi:hypothetical protein